jgi:hypothetical protein
MLEKNQEFKEDGKKGDVLRSCAVVMEHPHWYELDSLIVILDGRLTSNNLKLQCYKHLSQKKGTHLKIHW